MAEVEGGKGHVQELRNVKVGKTQAPTDLRCSGGPQIAASLSF